MVPKVGLEPTRHHWRQILSLVRLPFRHFGNRDVPAGRSARHRQRVLRAVRGRTRRLLGPPRGTFEGLQYSLFLKKSSSKRKKAKKKQSSARALKHACGGAGGGRLRGRGRLWGRGAVYGAGEPSTGPPMEPGSRPWAGEAVYGAGGRLWAGEAVKGSLELSMGRGGLALRDKHRVSRRVRLTLGTGAAALWPL